MSQSERWQKLGWDILSAARTELYLSLPFLDAALGALQPGEGYDTPTLATDAARLYYNGAWLAREYERSRSRVCRAWLHVLLHCLLRHPAKKRGHEGELWDLACDIAVEQTLDGLDYRCLDRPAAAAGRRAWYARLACGGSTLTAEAIYRALRRERLPVYEQAALARAFALDDHALWDRAQDDTRRRDWSRIAARTQTGMETVMSRQAEGGEAILERLRVENRPPDDYRAFLRRFAVLGETLRVDDDGFDYGYYAYGLRRYGNMPLIEPLETSEIRRIAELVVAIDTSMSTSGALVRAFLARTWSILRSEESFFRRFTLRMLQCDDQLRDDRCICSQDELTDYMENLTLTGGSATDFRPVFKHVAALQAAGQLQRLRGLLYFTDGLGVYPEKRPPYDAAFVMLAGQGWPDRVPPWGVRVVLDADELQGEA